MRTIIQNKLKEIESIHDIKILYACESGSRAWGFPSPNSDYDVRFIYTRSLDEYISIETHTDHLSFPISDELDIYGWDISKVLRLITKSNTTPFEWLQSPIVYRENGEFRSSLWELCQNYFCARSNTHHYLGIAHGAMDTVQNDEIKIKKLFYVLRPLLAAMWCIEKKEIAPMSIDRLMVLLNDALKEKIVALIDIKSTVEEGHKIKIDQETREWISNAFSLCKDAVSTLEKERFDIKQADLYLKKMILK